MSQKRKTKKTAVTSLSQELRDLQDSLATPGGQRAIDTYEFPQPRIDAKSVRKSLGMSRQDFAFTYGFSLRTLQNWEEARRVPEGPAKSYLIAIAYSPESVAQAMRDYRDGKVPASPGQPGYRLLPVATTETELVKHLAGEKVMRQEKAFGAESAHGAAGSPGMVWLGKTDLAVNLFDAARGIIQHPRSANRLGHLQEVVERMQPYEPFIPVPDAEK